TTLGGPRANRVAAQAGDGTLLVPFLTLEAVARAVREIREECERVGKDPSTYRIVHPIVCANDLSEDRTLAISASRFLTYVVGMPVFAKGWPVRNDWDPKEMERVLSHLQFQSMARPTADQTFHREQMMDAARQVPEEWMRSTCAIGSVEECVRT